MNSKYQRRITATTLFVIVAVIQTYVGVSFAARTPGSTALSTAAQGITGILTTAGNKPITVNGVSAATGATILSGATIETPDQVGATINFPGHGSLEIAPNSKFTLEFDQNGNIKLTLSEGCVTLHTKKDNTGEIDTSQGVAGKTGPAKDDVLRVCFPRGATAPIVDAGAGAGAGGGGGLGGGAIAGIVVGGTLAAVGLGLSLRGDNASPSSP